MPTPVRLSDIELVCSVLERMQRDGRGAAKAVGTERDLAKTVVSDTLRRVERHFGCSFVETGRARTGRLTEAGHLFLAWGDEILFGYGRLREQLMRLDHPEPD